ncbi:membrane dipeptidase [Flavobacterium sp. 81]|uniref:membrane dipeptidase n=1 Tax=Flavobacterium sp. 81 TaxID=2135621 RepID=UPI002101697B|nr:membrane dipeptidase [Flavobacterium sp. 81]
MSSNQEWNRRSFLTAMSGAGAAIMLSPFLSWAAIDRDPRIAEIVARTLGIDTHNHIDVPLIKSELPGPKVDLAGELKKSGLSAICMTFAVDYQKLVNPGDAYERFINGLSAMDEILKSNNMKRALNFADLQLAHKIKQPIVIQSVEGGHFLEGKIERLQIAYDRGLRHLGLLHDNDASVPLGDIFTKSPQWGGLTTFGAEVIKECERIGVLVDLSHCDDNTVNGALKIAKKTGFDFSYRFE